MLLPHIDAVAYFSADDTANKSADSKRPAHSPRRELGGQKVWKSSSAAASQEPSCMLTYADVC